MGDGGVACVSSQHIMEKFSICSKTNGKTKLNSSSKPTIKLAKVKQKMKTKKGKGSELSTKNLNAQIETNCNGNVNNDNDEVEEGELGTLPFESGEFVHEKPLRRSEIRSEIEKGEFIPEKWQKSGGELEKHERQSSKDELEKGEFVPDRWYRNDVGNRANEYDYSKTRRTDTAKEKGGRKCEREWTSPSTKERGWKGNRESEFNPPSRREKDSKADRNREWSPPSGRDKGLKSDLEPECIPPPSAKYFNEKDLARNSGSNQHFRKHSSRCEGEKIQKVSSKIVGEEGSLKNDFSHARDSSSVNRLKRHVIDSDNSDRKYHVDFNEHSSSKNRKLSDDHSRSGFSLDQYSGRSKPRASASSRSERYSSRYLESSRAVADRHNGSPHHSERSPRNRGRNHGHWERSPARNSTPSYEQGHPYDRSRSPYERSHHYGSRYRSPSYVERSPRDHGRNRDGRDRTPIFLERSPRDQNRHMDHRETHRKSGVIEKQTNHRGQEGKYNLIKDSEGKESQFSSKEPMDGANVDGKNISTDKTASNRSPHEESSRMSALQNIELSQENGIAEEPASMEEDMDICNTPPHAPQVADAVVGKWYYLDQFGVECGPSKLSDLKTLVKEGYLVSDHLIKHVDSDRWVSVEKAASPLVSATFSSIVPDTVTQLVCPPEAPGNLLADGTIGVPGTEVCLSPSYETTFFSEEDSTASKSVHDCQIDDRVRALLEGVTLIPGQEAAILAEVLQMTVEHNREEPLEKVEGYLSFNRDVDRHFEDSIVANGLGDSEFKSRVFAELSDDVLPVSESALACSGIGVGFSGQWACKGGDWKKIDDATQDRTWKRKQVLNDGYPLCLMPKSGSEDPRWEQKDELYFPSQSRRLDLPSWGFMSPDELNDPSILNRLAQTKSSLVRGVKGSMLSVIRINACVVKDQGSFVSESHVKVRGKERVSSRSGRMHSTTGESKKSSRDGHWKLAQRYDSRMKGSSIDIPKDHVCKVDELKLHLGDWYFLDGAGHEQGPQSFLELQGMADRGVIPKHISVYRKPDNLWVPVDVPYEPCGMAGHDYNLIEEHGTVLAERQGSSSSLHNLHPQFVGFTRGKLHELVMKSYKSREFAAAINEVLNPWINARQPKKEIDKRIYHSDHFHKWKRARTDGFEEESEMEEDLQTLQNDECEFDELCGDVTFREVGEVDSEHEKGSWDLLDGHVLARVFHFLRADVKSLFYAAMTCKHWRSVVNVYKDMARRADFGALAPNCSDSVILKIMNDFKREKITSVLLRGCTGITSGMLEELLHSFPFLSTIDIRGCTQFEDLVRKFPNINWVRSQGAHLKIRSLSHLIGSSSTSSQTDDSNGLKEYLESSDKRDSANQLFRRSLYKRSKLFDARKSSSILSRDAQLRHLAIKKIGNGYKRMEEYIAKGLQDIMSKNTFEFFEPKVAVIEQKMRNGYYTIHGLNSVKEDISRMCREAIKLKNRGDVRDMNRIVALFIQLATSLDKSSKLTDARHEMLKSWKDESPPGFSSTSSKYKRNLNKVSDRKHSYKNNESLMNGYFDSGDYTSDREIRRKLSKLINKSLVSGSDTSDDYDKSSDASMADNTSSTSDTESDLESSSGGAINESRGAACFTLDDGFYSFSDDREWGARMTKAALVPPVTRKYEVIDHYVIVADEEEVRRKMQVSLPEDYDEKLIAQRNGNEESDMEIPEVKDYKPRKSLGDEVIEQEVYGIDPYTHNLLLDSMPEESDWSLFEKHYFIEEVLLRTLNKQVRHFTGSGNTPMKYPLKPVFEEIIITAGQNNDHRTMHLCHFIMKAIDSRTEDNYVAYRKGLGVVCNKEGGFSEDDFVVEFLGEVYPTWKWFEKQDGIRALQKNSKDPVPEFYNIYLERPKGDADGYDLVVVDAMHKANYASRICHSCRPNCEAKVTAVDGQYQIGIYSVRPIAYGEEITFDYNSVTESKEEYEASVCLCGNQVCRGSYLNLTGEGAFQKVLKEHHGLLDRHLLLLEACELNSVSEEDYIDLGKAGLGSCLLGGLPDWLIAYSARLVRFINFERMELPVEILRHNVEEKKKYFSEIHMEVERSDAEIQAEGVYNQRLQNLALTIDKVKYVMRCVFGDPKKAPPPLERLSPEAVVSYIWKGEGSFVEELVQCLAPHIEDAALKDFKAKIHSHDPSVSDGAEAKLRNSLLWLRDEVRNLPCTYKSRNDAAADLIHIYVHTKCFFRIREYRKVTSPPVYITPLDLGPKYADRLRSGVDEYCKTYGERYCLGQLMFWYSQNAEPDATLDKASRGCLSLPDVGSFYAKVQKPSRQRVYGPRTVKFMLSRMEKLPQRPWPKDRIWSFKNSPKVVGTPMLDAVLNKAPIDKEMIHWLKHRHAVYHAMWDR